MKLHALQRTMARAVMQPLTKSKHMQEKAPGGGKMRAYASRFIKPNDRLSSFERLRQASAHPWNASGSAKSSAARASAAGSAARAGPAASA